jgi:integrase/recombinase XerD
VSALRRALADYLAVRRALGYKLERDEKLLGQLVAYLEEVGQERLSVEAALAWALLPGASAGWHGRRLAVARGFAAHLQTLDPEGEVPPPDLLPQRSGRATPYLYAEREILALMAAADALRSPLRAVTFRTRVGLLAATGLRVGEAIRLDRDDLDPKAGLITVRQSKFGKTREVPLHPSTLAALEGYLARRDELLPRPKAPALFLSTAGTRLLYSGVHLAFLDLVRRAGLEPRSARCRPRPHDLRHTFAVATLLGWYRDGADVPALLPRLSTYLGPVNPSATYWYLEAAPELLGHAGERLERHLASRP